MKIVVLEADAVGDVSYDPLKEFGELVIYEHTADKDIAERIADADIVVPNKCLMNEASMKDAKNLMLICEAATGINNIDISYCEKRGIPVKNVKAYSTESVVQHTFTLLLSLCEHLDHYASYIETGEYAANESFCCTNWTYRELYGKRFGVFGLGAIGRRVAEVATALGMEVVYYSASGNTYDVPYKCLDWDTFLSTCDVISCHAPLNKLTLGKMNLDAFKKMQPHAIFLNLGRGPIVVEKDLAAALENGEIAAAGLDVYEKEPLQSSSPLYQIRDRDRLLMTPHIAWIALEARERLVQGVADNIREWLSSR